MYIAKLPYSMCNVLRDQSMKLFYKNPQVPAGDMTVKGCHGLCGMGGLNYGSMSLNAQEFVCMRKML